MLTIKVWCLPKLSQKKLEKLLWDILEAIRDTDGMTEAGHTGTGNVLVLFPKDMMKFGLGDEVLIETEGLNATETTTFARFRQELAKKLGQVVQKHVPKAQIDSRVHRCYGVAGGVEQWQGRRRKMPAEKRPKRLK